MIAGAIIAIVLAIAVYFVSNFVLYTQRERISAAAIVSGASCLATAGFLVNIPLGFLSVGLSLVSVSLLLGYEQGE